MTVATFKAGGHEWRLRLTLGLVGRLRTDAGFELGREAGGGAFADALLFDPEKLGRVLWVLCHKEAEARGLDAGAFFDLLGPDEMEAAVLAVVSAVVEFFHPGRAAEATAKLPGLMRTVNEKVGAAMAAELDSILKKLGGSSPGSSAATGPASPSAS